MSLQEKMQILTPYNPNEDDGNNWTTDASARVSRPTGDKLNEMPPGMGINQENSEQNSMPFVMSGSSDASDDTNLQSFDKGFTRKAMDPCDDQYTGEHVDLFYGTVVDEEDHSKEGFAERNNYLDRM